MPAACLRPRAAPRKQRRTWPRVGLRPGGSPGKALGSRWGPQRTSPGFPLCKTGSPRAPTGTHVLCAPNGAGLPAALPPQCAGCVRTSMSPAPRGQCAALAPRKAAALPSHRVTRHQRLAWPEFQLHVHGVTSGPYLGGRGGGPFAPRGLRLVRSCCVSLWLTRFHCRVAFLHPVCVSLHGSSPLSR